MKDSGEDYDVILCYHAQQAIEKAIKAVMLYKGLRLRKTHNLMTLINLRADAGIHVPETSLSLERLTIYGLEDRYFDPVEEEDEPLDRLELSFEVSKIIEWAVCIVNK